MDRISPADIEELLHDANLHLRLQFPDIELLQLVRQSICESAYFQALPPDRLKLLLLDQVVPPHLLHLLNQALKACFTTGIQAHLDRAIRKPAKNPQHTPWHQDGGYWGKANCVRVWIALDEFEVSSGALRTLVIPNNELEAHSQLEATDFFGKHIADISTRNYKEVPLEAAMGEVLLFSETMVHGAFPNNSSEEKIALTGMVRVYP